MVIEGGDAIARILGGMDWAVGLGVRRAAMSPTASAAWSRDFLDIVQVCGTAACCR